MSYTIHMLSIPIDTKNLKQHQTVLVSYETEFFIMYGY